MEQETTKATKTGEQTNHFFDNCPLKKKLVDTTKVDLFEMQSDVQLSGVTAPSNKAEKKR